MKIILNMKNIQIINIKFAFKYVYEITSMCIYDKDNNNKYIKKI